MTVRELISELQNYNDNDEVVFKPSNSMYVETIESIIGKRTVRMFWGNDKKRLVLVGDEQIGAI